MVFLPERFSDAGRRPDLAGALRRRAKCKTRKQTPQAWINHFVTKTSGNICGGANNGWIS